MKSSLSRRLPWLVLCMAGFPAIAQDPLGGHVTTYYTFNSPYDGCCPTWSNLLAQGRDGNLYSTMPTGVSSAGSGTWFKYSPGGLPIIHPLQGGPNTPNSGLTLGVDGNLYGATLHGGLGNGAYGLLFKISGGALVPVYDFTGGTNGTYPSAAPIQGPDGYLYGTTYDGSTAGTVYKVNPSSGTLVWTHPLPSGTKAPLIIADDGNFYGTYPYGGMTINGVAPSNDSGGGVFRVTPDGVVTGVYNINPLNTKTNDGYGDGGQPWGPVMQASDGELYGAVSGGGQYNGGTVYKVNLDGSGFTVMHNFQTADGTSPQGGLVQGVLGYFYGMCSDGGVAQGVEVAKGTLFALSPGGTNFLRLFTFYRASGASGIGPGSLPLSTPTLHTNGIIYGLTSTGGSSLSGSSTYGAYDDGGELFSYTNGDFEFISIVGRRSAKANDRIGIIGQGFLRATGVSFGGVSAAWPAVRILSDTYMEVVVPPGARTGYVVVSTPSGNEGTLYDFKITCNGACVTPLSE
jgi:uncharacterized repeat protein (TIGR03803 family)